MGKCFLGMEVDYGTRLIISSPWQKARFHDMAEISPFKMRCTVALQLSPCMKHLV
jgi:hypothetical protein